MAVAMKNRGHFIWCKLIRNSIMEGLRALTNQIHCTSLVLLILFGLLFATDSTHEEATMGKVCLSSVFGCSSSEAATSESLTKKETKDKEYKCLEIERRIRSFLIPIYGDGHFAIFVTAEDDTSGQVKEDNKESKRHSWHISAVVLVDTEILSLPSSAEVLKAEEERLCTLTSYAAGLSISEGDKISVNFFSFQKYKKINTLSLYIILLFTIIVLLIFGAIYLLQKWKKPTIHPKFVDGQKNKGIYDRLLQVKGDILVSRDCKTLDDSHYCHLNDVKVMISDKKLTAPFTHRGTTGDLAHLLEHEHPLTKAAVLTVLLASDASVIYASWDKATQQNVLLYLERMRYIRRKTVLILQKIITASCINSSSSKIDLSLPTRNGIETISILIRSS